MSSYYNTEELYRLLPAHYRTLDAKEGEPLKALLSVISQQIGILEKDIEGLYRNWFIETCDEWVVPYIGDLLGIKGLYPVSNATYSLRAVVANTLAYRRRKGTAAILEQLAHDITGWNAHAVEFFQILNTTQHTNHIRLSHHASPDLRKMNTLELLDTPFDVLSHSIDVKPVGSLSISNPGGFLPETGKLPGKYNIPNIGIFLWRLQAYPMKQTRAFSHSLGRFSFSILGNDSPLFNHPQSETAITHLAEEINVPAPIRALGFAEHTDQYYGKGRSLCIYRNGMEIPSGDIVPANLSNWVHRPPAGKIAVDPVLGRFAFATGLDPDPETITVDYYYGFSSELGGGTYHRAVASPSPEIKAYYIGQKPGMSHSITQALNTWTLNGKPNAILQITDSNIYEEAFSINIPAGISLEINAADKQFPLIKLKSPLTIIGQMAAENQTKAQLTLDGLRIISNKMDIMDGDLGNLTIRHCTLVPGLNINPDNTPSSPGEASITATGGNQSLVVSLERSICGSIRLASIHDISIKESIIQGFNLPAVSGPTLTISGSTIMGPVQVHSVQTAADSIFTHSVIVRLTQTGCVRFCYLPLDSQAPRQYYCQPSLAIRTAIENAEKTQFPLPQAQKDKIISQITGWLKPIFTSQVYGTPGFVQLSPAAPIQIREGASDSSEPGVFQHLMNPRREANLKSSFNEYLPANMEAGIFYIN